MFKHASRLVILFFVMSIGCVAVTAEVLTKEDENGILFQQQQSFNFCAEYLEKYYPKVFVIRERFFAHMTPEEITIALRDIIQIFTNRPWFYFCNTYKNFNVVLYWEHIVDQCALLNQFLKNSRVDVDSNSVFYREDEYEFYSSASPFAKRTMRPLIDCIKKIDDSVIADFYALCFDYQIKLFNEGILLKDLQAAERYYYELEFVNEKLCSTIYEVDYQEAMRTGKELIALLKKNIGIDESLNKDYEKKDYNKRKTQEERLLGKK